MSEKLTRNQRRKLAKAAEPVPPSPGEIVRRRRTRRLLFLAVVAVLLPLLELLAYYNRSILFVIANRSDEVATHIKLTYPGGTIEANELKPGGEITHLARPEYTFSRDRFSTYRVTISVSTPGSTIRQILPQVGTIDYSARETFAIEPEGEKGPLQIKHTTYPGFPLGTIRDLLSRLGVG